MFRANTNRYTATFALLMTAACGWTALGAHAQVAVQRVRPPLAAAAGGRVQIPRDVPGEAVVRLRPGVNAQTIAQQLGIQVKRQLKFRPNIYVFNGILVPLDQAIQVLRNTPGVVSAATNRLYVPATLPAITPDDPYLNEQWALRQMNVPQFWGISVGERFVNGPRKNVVVALLDVGPDLSHPDLADNYDPRGYDFVNQVPYTGLTGFFDSHGTNVAGTIAAVTNNTEGIASIPWEAVTILPCQVAEQTTVNNVLVTTISTAAVMDAIEYCIEQQVDVINMSFADVSGGGPTFDPFVAQAITEASSQGIIQVAASGNGGTGFGDVAFPADRPEVIAVGAIGPSGERASYSQGGPGLELMAPGGNDNNAPPNPTNPTSIPDPTREILTTGFSGNGFAFFPRDFNYGYRQGTSMAAGYVSGLVATLITQGALNATLTPTERVDQMRQLLRATARNPFGQRTDQFGYGTVDAVAALKAITQYIDLETPEPNEVTESFSEAIQGRIVQPVVQPLTQADFQVFLNGNDVTSRTQVVNATTGEFAFSPGIGEPYTIGNNRINIIAESVLYADGERSLTGDATGRIPARTYLFRVQPHVENPGLKMFSVPYILDPGTQSLNFLFGGNVVALARWLPDQERYAIFEANGGTQDPEASLLTSDAGVAHPPVGIGFWARVTSQTQVQLFGKQERAEFYDIPLKPGFNQVGDPYPFRVPFNVVEVVFGNEVLTIQEAARRNLVRDVIWRYANGRYQFAQAPNGELIPWESVWIRAFEFVSLRVPRFPSTIGNSGFASTGAAGQASGWRASIRALANGRVSGEVTLGAADRGRNGFGPEDIEMPPPARGPLDLRIRHSDWGRDSGRYARDIRARGPGAQTWDLEVETLQPDRVVKLMWDRFPPGTRASLEVDGKPGVHSLTRQRTLRFMAARPGVHRVRIVAYPDRGA